MAETTFIAALTGALQPRQKSLAARPVDNRGGWWGIVRESFTGAWQQNVEVRVDTVLTYSTVFRCISLISSDVAKMRLKLVEQGSDGIWEETESPAFSPVIRKPNRSQNRIQFFTNWMESRLIHGNTYVLKQRDERGVVAALYVLDPNRVKPLVTPDGDIFYQLTRDDLAGVPIDEIAPASEIIHDRWNTIYHPLVGTSPIYACGLAAVQGLKIQNGSAHFFGNGGRPAGILSTDGALEQEDADKMKEAWERNYSGTNAGRTAVLADGLKYQPIAMTAVDSQLIEQLKWTSENICSVFGVPAYKAGVGTPPGNNNVEALDQQYYAQCLQIHIESIELCLDEGLGLNTKKSGVRLGTEFELDDLLRMDTATLINAEAEAVKAGIKAPNEARRRLNLKPVTGGKTPYLQQQNYSLEALDARDRNDPFAKPAPAAPATPPADAEADAPAVQSEARDALVEIMKGLR